MQNGDSGVQTVALAMTGASGAVYGLQLLRQLLAAGKQVYLMVSTPGQIVINMETSVRLPGKPREIQQLLAELYQAAPAQLQVFGHNQWTAPVASGTGVADAMVVCPCTMGTLASIANGLSSNLIERAADVSLKERKTLILVPRETPFSSIHLQNMLSLSQAGAVILPPNPGFYQQPQTLEDIVNFIVARILDHLGIAHQLVPGWGTEV